MLSDNPSRFPVKKIYLFEDIFNLGLNLLMPFQHPRGNYGAFVCLSGVLAQGRGRNDKYAGRFDVDTQRPPKGPGEGS